MNVENNIAYDALTKKIKSSNEVIHEIPYNKEITSTAYTKIATICPILSGTLKVNLIFANSVQSRGVWAAIYLGNTLISEAQLTSTANYLTLSLPIEQAMTNYELKVKKDSQYFYYDATVEKIQLCGDIYDTGKFFVPIQVEA